MDRETETDSTERLVEILTSLLRNPERARRARETAQHRMPVRLVAEFNAETLEPIGPTRREIWDAEAEEWVKT